MNIKLKYASRERSGLFMYHREIPRDLRQFYKGNRLRRQSLRTHDQGEAMLEIQRLAKLDNQIWQALKDGAEDLQAATEAVRSLADMSLIHRVMKARAGPSFSQALAMYFKRHSGKDAKFAADVNRVFDFAKSILGDPAMSNIKRMDAGRVLTAYLALNMKTASVRRNMAVLSAIYNVGILEFELEGKANPFAAHRIPDMLADAREVPSFSDEELHKIAEAALTQRSTEALIPCMQIETGCRISEIAMLRIEDLHLDAAIPYVDIVEHQEHGRRLKTGKAGERVLPLLGVSLEASRLALAAAKGDGWLFKISHKLPSSRVNAWLSKTLGGQRGSHSFRHSMESRLVLARTDQRLVDAVLGHAPQAKMGSVYFSGFSLADIAEALNRIVLPILP